MLTPRLILAQGWRGVRDYLQGALSAEVSDDPLRLREVLVLVPTAAAGHLLQTSLESELLSQHQAIALPKISTVSRLLVELTERSLGRVRAADAILREALVETALAEAAESGAPPPFRARGSLAPRILSFLEHLHLTGHRIDAFIDRCLQELDVPDDLGAERMTSQTRFLAETVRRYREKLRGLGLEDAESLRSALIERGAPFPYGCVFAIGADTLWPADLAFLRSQKALTSLELIIPESAASTWRIEALRQATPLDTRREPGTNHTPCLWYPEGQDHRDVAWSARDREEVLRMVAQLLKSRAAEGRLPPLERIALVVPSPLPYIYLAKKTLGPSGIPYQLQDDFPLATEPYLAATELILDYVAEGGGRSLAIALLQSPFLRFAGVDADIVAGLSHTLSQRRAPAGGRAWRRMLERRRRPSRQRPLPGMAGREKDHLDLPALEALVEAGKRLAPLADDRTPLTEKTEALRSFLDTFGRPLPALDDAARHERARGAFLSVLQRLADSARRLGDPPCPFERFREKLHRAVESHTFSIRTGHGGVHIVDRRVAGLGSFDLVILVGLNEGEWPARSERNIFYPQSLLRHFGWPTEVELLASERTRFIELLRAPRRFLALARHLLEDDVPTVASPFLEEVEVSVQTRREALSSAELKRWLVSRPEALRARAIQIEERFSAPQPAGLIRQMALEPEPVSATAFELYLRCPFKYYVRYVLGIEEEEDLEEGLTPLERGRILHDILHTGFDRWDAHETGPRPITPESFDQALELFRNVAVEKLPVERRTIELERLFGGPGAAGAIEWLLRWEMGRGPLQRRLLEHRFQNRYAFDEGPKGESPWSVRIKGRADRVDIDARGGLHVFDYKTGRAPEPKLTIQVPLYARCLSRDLGARPVEAAYVSLRDHRVVARQDDEGTIERLRQTYRSISEGHFPPRPCQEHLCSRCGYARVCRKEIESENP